MPVAAYSYRPTRTYSAVVQAGLSSSSTGGGFVYVDEEATGPITVPEDKWRPNSSEEGSEGGNSSTTQNEKVPVYLYAKANTGYEFKGWSDSNTGTPENALSPYVEEFPVGDNSWAPIVGYYNRKKYYTRYAFFSPIEYVIRYIPDGGTLSGSDTQRYTIKRTDALRTVTRMGYSFNGWKVTSVGAEGNWTLYHTLSPGTRLSNNYGDVTLTAQWEVILCPITIRLSGMDAGDSGIFTVSKDGTVLYTVSVPSGASVTIKDAEAGNYTVTPTDWNWAYSGLTEQSYDVVDPVDGHTFEFAASKNTSRKHDEKSNVNFQL